VEIEKIKETLQRMEENNLKSYNAYLSEIRKNFKLTKQLEKYEDESLTRQTLSKAKEKIWVDINSTIIDIWRSIKIMFEQEELVIRAKSSIIGIKEDLDYKLGQATRIIKVLNSRTKEELEEL